jgi:hypothetical protein
MSQEPPTLDYAKPVRERWLWLKWWPSLTSAMSLVLAFHAVPRFRCMCGYLDAKALAASIPAFALACLGWVGNKEKNLLWRAVLILVVIATFGVLSKNVADVLWLGHEPLWP